jgi:hypothetical protein
VADILREAGFDLGPQELGRLLETATGGMEVPGEPTDSGDESRDLESVLVRLVEARYHEAEGTLWPLRKKWALNDEFFSDNQWAAWDRDRKVVVSNPRRDYPRIPRIQLNIFKPTIVTAISRFLATKPQIIVKAGNTDPEAVEGARVAEKVIGVHEWQQQKMDEVLAQALPILMLHGTVILKTEWNPTAGEYLGKKPVLARDEDGEPLQMVDIDPMSGMEIPQYEEDGVTPRFMPELDEMGQPILRDAWEGAVETSVVDSTDFIVDPTVTNFRDAMWCMHVTARSPAWVYNRWGVEVGFDGSRPQRRDAAYSRWRQGLGGQYRQADDHGKTVEVKELWIKPGRYKYGKGKDEVITFPKGYVAVVADNKVLSHGENPYDHGELPFVFVPALRVPGELWGDTIANSLRVTQVTLNKTASQITLANDLCGNPQWLIPSDIKLKEADRSNMPGAWKIFEPQPHGLVPTMHPGQGPAAAVFRYLDQILSINQQISGMHEGGLAGGNPPNIEAGVALAALVERDTSRLAYTAMEYGRGIERWTWLNLRLLQQFKTKAEVVSIVGRFMESETVEFSGASIRDDFEVSVVPQSVQPQSKAAKFQEAAGLFQMGLIGPKDALNAMGFEAPEQMTVDQIEIENARNENFEARKFGRVSTPPEYMQLENGALHVEEHRRELLSPTIRADPQAYQALYQHLALHELIEVQRMQAQAAAAAPPPEEAPPEEGGGSTAPSEPTQQPVSAGMGMTDATTVPPTG